MKTSYLIVVVLIFGVSWFMIQEGESLREIFTLDETVNRADVILIGTVENTWVDIRPFDEYVIVDTAKIRVHEWLKNKQNSETIEIRYYGYWAKTIDSLRGRTVFDMPVHSYDGGQNVLLHLFYEKPSMIMGQGYYPSYEGSYTIQDDIAVSQTGNQMKLDEIRNVIADNLNIDVPVSTEPETKPVLCEPTDYEKTRKCLDYYHCSVDANASLNNECIETDKGISVREMCSNPDNVIIQKSNGCMILPMVDVKVCGSKYSCPENP